MKCVHSRIRSFFVQLLLVIHHYFGEKKQLLNSTLIRIYSYITTTKKRFFQFLTNRLWEFLAWEIAQNLN